MCYQVGGRGEGTAPAMTALQQGNKTGDGAGGGRRGGHVVMPPLRAGQVARARKGLALGRSRGKRSIHVPGEGTHTTQSPVRA